MYLYSVIGLITNNSDTITATPICLTRDFDHAIGAAYRYLSPFIDSKDANIATISRVMRHEEDPDHYYMEIVDPNHVATGGGEHIFVKIFPFDNIEGGNGDGSDK